jgi:hypothetical protein
MFNISPVILGVSAIAADIREAGNQHGQAQIDPPMRDVHIIASPPSGYDVMDTHVSTKIHTRSRGLDLHGEFTLKGKI